MPEIEGELKLCKNGYHLCRSDDLLDWLGSTIYKAEYDGKIVEGKDKVVVLKCRLTKQCENWTEESARLFACWCLRNTPLADGRRVWALLTDITREAVEVSERYARGEANEKELEAARAAAGAAAWAAAWAAAETSAWAAAREAAWAAARAAAETSAWDAVRAAARDAAWTSAWAAAREAQTKELLRLIEGGKDEK
jgi:hypothetical protein